MGNDLLSTCGFQWGILWLTPLHVKSVWHFGHQWGTPAWFYQDWPISQWFCMGSNMSHGYLCGDNQWDQVQWNIKWAGSDCIPACSIGNI